MADDYPETRDVLGNWCVVTTFVDEETALILGVIQSEYFKSEHFKVDAGVTYWDVDARLSELSELDTCTIISVGNIECTQMRSVTPSSYFNAMIRTPAGIGISVTVVHKGRRKTYRPQAAIRPGEPVVWAEPLYPK